MNTQDERFEEVFNAGIKAIHEVNVKTYGTVMANLMFPAFESLKPVFKATYDQGVKDQQEKLEGCVVVPVEQTQAMIEAGRYRQWDDLSSPYECMYTLIYKAMLEAARGGNE